MVWLQAGRTLGKSTACPARPTLFWLNPVLFSSRKEFPGFELYLPEVHSPLPVTGEAADHTVCLADDCLIQSGLAVVKLSGAQTALYHGPGAVQTHQDSDLFWSEPLGVSETQQGMLSCFLSISRVKAHFSFPSPSSLGGFV